MVSFAKRALAVLCLFFVLSELQGCASGSSNNSTVVTTPPASTPSLALTSINPAQVPAGASTLTLTLNGTGFTSTSAVQIGTGAVSTSYVSTTQLTASIPASQLALGALLPVAVANNATAVSNSINLEVDNPTPAVTALAPAMLVAGSAAGTVSINGTGFIPTTTVQVNGTTRTATYVTATQMNVSLTQADVTASGSLTVTTVNPAPGGGTSAAAALPVNNGVPSLMGVSPSTVNVGATPVMLAITGTNFTPASVVMVGATPRATTFVNSTQLTAQLTVADQATAGALSITIGNPAPGGGVSKAFSVTVMSTTAPTITAVNPAKVSVNSGTSIVAVTGTNFVKGAVIRVNGITHATTFVDATVLTCILASGEISSVGTLQISVQNPNGEFSGTTPLSIVVGPAVISSPTPTSFIAGGASTSISVFGTGLTSGSVVLWNGIPLATTPSLVVLSPLYAVVPAALIAAPGTATITVKQADPTVAVSNALSVSILPPPVPTLTSVQPSSGPMNTDVMVTVTGRDFPLTTSVAYNGTNLPIISTNVTTLTVKLPATLHSLPGVGFFTVTVPAPGGGTSAAVPFTSYAPLANNSMIYNPANSLFYASVPSSAGAPYGNCVVSIDPATGALGKPIPVGSEPNKLAITSDGKYLWVGLDGASAVRKVDLATGTAGMQFNLPANTAYGSSAPIASALVALPGSTDSVIVSYGGSNSSGTAIYDSGVIRGSALSNVYNVLLTDGTRSEVYAGGNIYAVYTYDSSGLTLKASNTAAAFASPTLDDMQIVGGKLYTSMGKVLDPETGALQATLYSSGTSVATGSTTADASLGKAFVLGVPASSSGPPTQIQAFNTADYTTAEIVPVTTTPNNTYNRLTRWGSNGLAFRGPEGLFALRSTLVKDLTSTNADLSVALSGSGTATGAVTTYTATVTNNGPASATSIVLAALVPSTGTLSSITSTAGICSTAGLVTCNLGALASGANATVTLTMQQLSPGTATLTVQVSASENDAVSTNNQATLTSTITGSSYSAVPVLGTLTPNAIKAGSADTIVTVAGSGFTPYSTVNYGSTALATTYVSSTQLTAVVGSSDLQSLGWGKITVSTPAPGGSSAALPLSVFSVVTAPVNHILYDPFSRQIYSSIRPGSVSPAGNSVAPLNPETGAFGPAADAGGQPTTLALSDDGSALYALLNNVTSITRFNTRTTLSKDFTFSPAFTDTYNTTYGFRDVAVQTGSANTLAVDFGVTAGLAIVDVDPIAKTGITRGTNTGGYNGGTSLHFYDSQTLYTFGADVPVYQTLDKYTLTSAGFSANTTRVRSFIPGFNRFQLSGKFAFVDSGLAADVSTTPASQLGIYKALPSSTSYANTLGLVAPDTSLGSVFFFGTGGGNGLSNPDSILAYNQANFINIGTTPLVSAATEGTTFYQGADLIRWGQDGLALLTSTGHIYLLRGGAVVPQLLNNNTAAVLTSSSSTSATHGAGNTYLTLTGSNFVPGIAVNWNGAYRTTTIVDSTHLSVAIPASDLAVAGTATLTLMNPGASVSSGLTFTIN